MKKYAHNIRDSSYCLPIEIGIGLYIVRATMTGGETADNKFVRL